MRLLEQVSAAVALDHQVAVPDHEHLRCGKPGRHDSFHEAPAVGGCAARDSDDHPTWPGLEYVGRATGSYEATWFGHDGSFSLPLMGGAGLRSSRVLQNRLWVVRPEGLAYSNACDKRCQTAALSSTQRIQSIVFELSLADVIDFSIREHQLLPSRGGELSAHLTIAQSRDNPSTGSIWKSQP